MSERALSHVVLPQESDGHVLRNVILFACIALVSVVLTGAIMSFSYRAGHSSYEPTITQTERFESVSSYRRSVR